MVERKTRPVKIGNLIIGGGAPIAVQSMTNTKTEDVTATVKQIKELEGVGCELVRVAVRSREALEALANIKSKITIPLVADIHFHWEYALEAIRAGVDKVRINPGNIGSLKDFAKVVEAAASARVPLRIGVNAGSLHPKFNKEQALWLALVKSCLEYVNFCEKLGFTQLVLSVKASSVRDTVLAYQALAKETDYPLHLGITEAGSLLSGTIKSAVGLGILLNQGIGDTIRVSLAADPVREVEVGFKILQALELRSERPEVIACPTCGRADIDVVSITEQIEKKLAKYRVPIKVAVMGCVVNGPGEARHADVGLAGGKGEGVLFSKGKALRRVPTGKMVDELMSEVNRLLDKLPKGR
jgi:(E)-4-hydroxy-3-methylbut-2-enyl-diphosphate synthase